MVTFGVLGGGFDGGCFVGGAVTFLEGFLLGWLFGGKNFDGGIFT